MLAGDKAWNEESPSVAHFTLENIQDILEYFDNPLYLKIIEIIRNRLQQGEPVNTTFFIQHTLTRDLWSCYRSLHVSVCI
ncbi:MAG: hypothetical protein U0T81_13405 [Saprospiraceae bacterium]